METFAVVVSQLLTLCHGEYNFALNKPAAASSVYSTGSAALAFDGNTDPDFHRGSCYHGRTGMDPWLQVDLEKNVIVTRVKVTNRGDCCGDRVRDFSIDLYDEDPRQNPSVSPRRCLYYEGQFPRPGITTPLSCTDLVWGRYLRLTSHGTQMLNFCELQVFGFLNIMPSCSSLVLKKGQRLTSPSVLTLGPEVASRATCASECNRRLTCMGFNIKYSSTVTCELVDSSENSETDTIWDAYVQDRCNECL